MDKFLYNIEKYEQSLAPYAAKSSQSLGRLYEEKSYEEQFPLSLAAEESKYRSIFQKDRDRVIHSTSFRRLEYKTQVFLYNEGDHYRTRLTHSIEVAQLARSVASIFGVDQDLAEVIALSHDLGHSPFGHAGERALKELMKDYGGFDHNIQTIKILTYLERKYNDFYGLNISHETLEGLAKHNGPIDKPLQYLAEYSKKHDLLLDKYPSLEAQIANICDDIAYNSHDLEDGLKAGLFTLMDVVELPIINDIYNRYSQNNFGSQDILINKIRSDFIKEMLTDVKNVILQNLSKVQPKSIDDIRNAKFAIVDFSKEFMSQLNVIRGFLREKMYHNHNVLIMTKKGMIILEKIFNFYMENPDCLPNAWQEKLDLNSDSAKANRIADFIAGMTDRYAIKMHNKIFDTVVSGYW